MLDPLIPSLSRSRLPLRRKPIVREELPVFKNPTYACDYGYSSACARACEYVPWRMSRATCCLFCLPECPWHPPAAAPLC